MFVTQIVNDDAVCDVGDEDGDVGDVEDGDVGDVEDGDVGDEGGDVGCEVVTW